MEKLIESETNYYKLNIDKALYTIEEIENKLKEYSIGFGGKYSPKTCKSEQKIAIIIPYRDRLSNLKLFLSNMHPFLINQNLTYGIYLIEPNSNLTFNRGLLMNIGYVQSLKDSDNQWDCFFFHDVDMLPEDVRNTYRCDHDMPVHYAVAVSKFGYSTTGYFDHYYGGINAFTKDQFEKINGFSNRYFGWGDEDDDLRIRTEKLIGKYRKRPSHINRYFMDGHKKQPVNKKRNEILADSKKNYGNIGIKEGLTTLKYTLTEIRIKYLFTHIFVDHPSSYEP